MQNEQEIYFYYAITFHRSIIIMLIICTYFFSFIINNSNLLNRSSFSRIQKNDVLNKNHNIICNAPYSRSRVTAYFIIFNVDSFFTLIATSKTTWWVTLKKTHLNKQINCWLHLLNYIMIFFNGKINCSVVVNFLALQKIFF